MVSIESYSSHPELVSDAVGIAWSELGAHLPEVEFARWQEIAERDRRLHTPFSAGFVAVEEGRAVGTVQLHEFDLDSMRDRSPWISGMVVRPAFRGRQIGRQLLDAVCGFVGSRGIEQLWVFTLRAALFYEACGWERFGDAEQSGERGVVLTLRLPTESGQE